MQQISKSKLNAGLTYTAPRLPEDIPGSKCKDPAARFPSAIAPTARVVLRSRSMARPEPDGLISAFDDVFSEFNRSDAPGLVVGISQYGKGLYRRGFGLACLELGVANTPSTRMRIASASKHFTCIAALLLAEEGKLDIDASIRSYVPELPILAGEPTLRQLMTHTGGYRCYLDLHMLGNGGAAMEKGRALNYQLQQHDVNFAPGERMMYCNG